MVHAAVEGRALEAPEELAASVRMQLALLVAQPVVQDLQDVREDVVGRLPRVHLEPRVVVRVLALKPLGRPPRLTLPLGT